MQVCSSGYDWIHPKEYIISRPEGSIKYHLLLIKSTAFFTLGGKEYIVKPNTVILINNSTPHTYHALDDVYTDDWVVFDATEEEVREIRENLKIPFDTFIHINDITPLSMLIKNLFLESTSKKNMYKNETKILYLRLVLLKLSELIHHPSLIADNRYLGIFMELRNDISTHPGNNWSIDTISKRLNLSRSYIQHMYKTIFGHSITEEVTKSRIEYAKYLLAISDMSVATVATRCGYENAVHFMRVFKKHTSHTPTEFRKQSNVPASYLKNMAKQESLLLYEN